MIRLWRLRVESVVDAVRLDADSRFAKLWRSEPAISLGELIVGSPGLMS
jgi:hypothetical protein